MFYNGHTCENLKPSEAYSRGYLTFAEYRITDDWDRGKINTNHINTLVYVDGVYVGVGFLNESFLKIIERYADKFD